MGAETEIIEQDVTIADASVSSEGFGVPLIAAYHNFWPERVRDFDEADELLQVPYNVPIDDPLYLTALRAKSQNPGPSHFKVGRLTGAFTQIVELVPATPTEGAVYSLVIDGQAVTVTAPATPTVASVATLLATAIGAVTGVTPAATTTKVTVTSVATGKTHSYESLSQNLTLTDVTALPTTSVAADLAAIRAADDDWYVLLLANAGGKAAILNAANWVESQKAIFFAQSSDAGVVDPASTTDVLMSLQSAGYHRTSLWFHEKPTTQQLAAGIAGAGLPKLPGPFVFANKTVAGVDKSNLSATARGALKTKKGNAYQLIKKRGFTLNGWAVSGRFIDITVVTDWFSVGVEDRVLLLLANNDVVAYTQQGIELCRSAVLGQILEGIRIGVIDGQQPYAATAPKLIDIEQSYKADRLLPDLGYSYVIASGIQKVRIKGTVKV